VLSRSEVFLGLRRSATSNCESVALGNSYAVVQSQGMSLLPHWVMVRTRESSCVVAA
jgi:hypothetical protein